MDYLLVNKIREKGTEKDKMIYFYSVHFMNNIQNAMNSIEISDVSVHTRKCIEAYSYIWYLINDTSSVNSIQQRKNIKGIHYKIDETSTHKELQMLYEELSTIEIHVASYKENKGRIPLAIFGSEQDEKIQRYKNELVKLDTVCSCMLEGYLSTLL